MICSNVMFKPDAKYAWMRSHAQLPTPVVDDLDLKVYFASRDKDNRSHVCMIFGQLKEGFQNFKLHENPILEPGPFGGFDDHGVYPSSIVKKGKEWWMYYIGWNPSLSAPIFYATIGLAVSHDNGKTFQKLQNYPVLGRNEVDPLLVTAPFVMMDSGVFRMWYVSGVKWQKIGERWKSWYHIKYAESPDGVHWKREGRVAIDFKDSESNLARPWVIKQDSQYRMWYCKCSDTPYSLGYAESKDGISWERKDDRVQIPRLPCGFDSEAQAYPALFDYEGTQYLLYNGNNYGKEGFAIAKVKPMIAP